MESKLANRTYGCQKTPKSTLDMKDVYNEALKEK